MAQDQNTDQLRALCHHWGASLFGVADLGSFNRGEILLPSTILDPLPRAISVGYHLSDTVLEEIEDRPTPLYFQHYQRTNILLDTVGLILTTAIQEQGYQAVPIPASQLVDWKNQKGHLSHKHVARAAGLGWIGRNNLLVTERYGSRVRLVTVLTNLPLKPDSPCDKGCASCFACVAACPARAIAERQSDFNHVGCYEQLKVFSKTLHFSHHICGVCVKACKGQR